MSLHAQNKLEISQLWSEPEDRHDLAEDVMLPIRPYSEVTHHVDGDEMSRQDNPDQKFPSSDCPTK